VIDCWRLLPDDASNGAVEIVRLGRAQGQASPVLGTSGG
jgi:hypothetical protein